MMQVLLKDGAAGIEEFNIFVTFVIGPHVKRLDELIGAAVQVVPVQIHKRAMVVPSRRKSSAACRLLNLRLN